MILNRFEEGAFVDPLIAKTERKNKFSRMESRLLRRLVPGVIENRTYLDHRIDNLLFEKKPLPATIRNVLRLGVYQIMFLNGIPDRAAVSESVRLASDTGFPGLKGLINGILRNLLRSGVRHDSDLDGIAAGSARFLSVKYSHPLWLVKRWIERFGYDETENLLKINNRPSPLTIQVNSLKATEQQVFEELSDRECRPVKSRFNEGGIIVKGSLDLTSMPTYGKGGFYVQDESARLITSSCPSDPTLGVVDLCSAPGGKLVSLAITRRDKGLMIGNDLSPGRLSRLVENVSRLGLKSIKPVLGDCAMTPFSGHFDIVLVDVPCSGTGTLGKKAELRWRIRESWFRELNTLQVRLIESAANLVAPGGILVYSTCSIESEENESIVERFLRKRMDFSIRDKDSRETMARFWTDLGFFQSLPQRDACDGAFAAFLERE